MESLVRIGNNIIPAICNENGNWFTTWPDGELRTCSPDEVLKSYIKDNSEWIIEPINV